MPAIVSASPRIALIHSAQGDVDPVERAIVDHWPEVERLTLLDDALNSGGVALAESVPSSSALSRFRELTDYAVSMCAQGILYTCSQFGDAIEAVRTRWRIPMLKPHEALFLSALEHGSRLGLVTVHDSQIEPLQREFLALADEAGASIELSAVAAPELAGVDHGVDGADLDDLLRERSQALRSRDALQSCDAIMLPDYSVASAAPSLRRAFDRPVLAAPDAAVLLLRQLLSAR